MRSLTRSEVAVIGAVLSDLPGGERRRIADAGVPRSTYQSIRQRALAAGWMAERYVPSLRLLGVSELTLSIVQPFAEDHRTLVDSLSSQPNVPFLWDSPDTVVAVSLGDAERVATARARSRWEVRVGGTDSAVPAYFDFGGAWGIHMQDRGPSGYPKGLPTPSGSRPRAFQGISDLRTLRRLLTASKPAGDEPDPTSAFGRLRVRRRIRALTAAGDLERRYFLDPAAVPAVPDRPVDRVVLVRGRRRPGSNPRELLGTLVGSAGVAPFLYAYDPGSIVIGGLSPRPTVTASRPRASVLELLEQHLEAIEILREPLSTLRLAVAHDFGRCLAAARPVPRRPSIGPAPAGG